MTTISIKQFGDEFRVIAEREGKTEELFRNITFLNRDAAGSFVQMEFWDKFNCRRVAGKWILEV